MSVNLPCGWSFARFSFQRPDATSESDDNSVISRQKNVNVPIFARLEYFFLYRSRTVCQPCSIISPETKTVHAERAYPLIMPSKWPHSQASHCARSTFPP